MKLKPLNYENFEIIKHPLVQHKLLLLRDINTGKTIFRQVLKEIGMLLGYEITRGLTTTETKVETPLGTSLGYKTSQKDLVIVPILRAGLGMADGLLELVPGATVGHIGCYRDEKTKQPVEYLAEIPQHMGKTFILVDPMIATGNSAKFAVHLLKNRGVLGEDIKFMALLAAPEGVQVFQDAHPDVHLLAASLDSNLDKNAFILPGLGDAGDRLFGTTK